MDLTPRNSPLEWITFSSAIAFALVMGGTVDAVLYQAVVYFFS